MIRTIALYEFDRAYGGPEEGGWWFTTSTRMKIASGDVADNRLHLLRRAWEAKAKALTEDARSRYGTGCRYAVDVVDWAPLDKALDPAIPLCGCDGYDDDFPEVWMTPDVACPPYTPTTQPHYC
jgi:hypothetical protein